MRVRSYAGGCEFLPLSCRVLSGSTWTERYSSRRFSVIESFTVLKEECDVRQGGPSGRSLIRGVRPSAVSQHVLAQHNREKSRCFSDAGQTIAPTIKQTRTEDDFAWHIFNTV